MKLTRLVLFLLLCGLLGQPGSVFSNEIQPCETLGPSKAPSPREVSPEKRMMNEKAKKAKKKKAAMKKEEAAPAAGPAAPAEKK